MGIFFPREVILNDKSDTTHSTNNVSDQVIALVFNKSNTSGLQLHNINYYVSKSVGMQSAIRN